MISFTRLLLSLIVKQFWNLVNICQSYGQLSNRFFIKHGVNTTVDICATFLPFNGFSCLPISIFRRDASICIARISYSNVSVWVVGWVVVRHSRCCINTTKPILKLFRPSGSPIIEVMRRYQIPRVTPSAAALNTRVVVKIDDFRRISPFISETVRDRPMVTMERHGCRIEWYNFWWPWVTPNPGFKVTTYFEVEYRKNGAS